MSSTEKATNAGVFGKWINALIAFSLQHRVAVVGSTLLVAAAGVWAFATLNTDAFPDLTPNQVLVMTEAPGLSPVEVEQQVSYPMEVAMLGLPGTSDVRSISKVGLSVVTVTFDDAVNLFDARAQVQQRMQDAMTQLPEGAEAMLGPPATAMGEAFQYVVEATSGARDSATLIELTKVQEYLIAPMLRTVPGVAGVNAWGGLVQQFQVNADPARLAGYGLTLEDVETALTRNNANFGAGYIEDRGERLTLRALGRVSDTTDIGNVVVTTRNATPVYVRDVARVSVGGAPRFGAVTRDGQGEAVSAVVLLQKGANGREVIDRVTARLEEIRRVLPKGVQVRPFYSQADVVKRTTNTVFRNLIEGALLVIAILFLFLRNARASLLTASVIPLSLLIAFLAMKRFGVTANLMSLGALDFGLLVDSAVVLVENAIRRLGMEPDATPVRRQAVLREAAFEVGRPIVFGVAVIVAVYIPIFSLGDSTIEGKMFTPMAFTVCAAILGSLLLALTYVPAASALLFAKRAKVKPGSGSASAAAVHTMHDAHEPGWFVWLRNQYVDGLRWALSHRRTVIAGALGLMAIALGSVPFLGTEFMPKLDEGYLLVETRRAPSASLAEGTAISENVERTLRQFPEVAGVVTNLGRPHEATETMALNQADVYVLLSPRDKWRVKTVDDLIPQLDSALDEIPGLTFEFSAPMRMRLDEVVSGVKTDLGIRVYGDSLQDLQEKAEAIQRVVERIPGAAGASVGVSAGAMQLEVALDRSAIARYGLNVADVRDAIETGIGGSTATQIIDGRKRFDVVVRLDPAYRSTPEAVGQTLLRTPAGGTIALSQVAQLSTVEAPEVVNHQGGQRFVVVQSNVRGRDLGGFVADVQRAIGEQITLPSGYYVTYGGQFENQQRAMRRLSLIVPAVLLLIAGLLYTSFGTMRLALLVMLNVPFALVGGIAALWLRGLHLNLSASIGMIALAGIAVLNGLVLLSYVEQLRAGGRSLADAVRESADVRLRPVLMTALVASVGFIPMAVSTSACAEVQRPLATVVIGGLVSATLLTLFVLPTVYTWIEERAAERRELRFATTHFATTER